MKELENFPRRKTSLILTDFPVRNSRNSSISDLSSKIEPLSGSPKRIRLQALESESSVVFEVEALAGGKGVRFAGFIEAVLAYEGEAEAWEGACDEESNFSRLSTLDIMFCKILVFCWTCSAVGSRHRGGKRRRSLASQ